MDVNVENLIMDPKNIRSIEYIRTIDSNDFYKGILNDKDVIFYAKSFLMKNINFKNIKMEKTFENNRFFKYSINFNNDLHEIFFIYPVLDEDHKKLLPLLNKKRISETYDMYINNIYPNIINQNLDWIDNIVNNKIEPIDYEDDDFIFLPDMKWDKKSINKLYYLAIVKNKNLRSIRDLNCNHLLLLKKIYQIGVNIIHEKYGIFEDKLRIYLHYHPSFWQLHIHFNLLQNYDFSTSIEHCHTLLSVTNNVELIPDYYQKITIEVTEKSQ